MDQFIVIEKRAQQLQEAIDEKGDAFIGVEVHFNDKRFFEEGRVLAIDDGQIIIDIRKTLTPVLKENGVQFPGVLILKMEDYTPDYGFRIHDCAVFITD